jgi:hypothetical protein
MVGRLGSVDFEPADVSINNESKLQQRIYTAYVIHEIPALSGGYCKK